MLCLVLFLVDNLGPELIEQTLLVDAWVRVQPKVHTRPFVDFEQKSSQVGFWIAGLDFFILNKLGHR